jgi:hypothetical protein
MRIKATIAAAAILAFAAGAAQADVLKFTAALKGATAVPATSATGRGEITAMVDSDSGDMTYTVDYAGLSGPAVAAQFEGPGSGASAGPVIATAPNVAAPITGSMKLNSVQLHELKAGAWYFDIQTGGHPSGEIGGRLTRRDFE